MTHRVPRHKEGQRPVTQPPTGHTQPGHTRLLVAGPAATADADQLVLAELTQLEPEWQPANLDHPDITRLNPDTALSIALVREVQTQLGYPPLQRPRRYLILYRLDQASAPAQHALLKSLEEPPAYVTIIATTARLEALLPTIQSRCVIRHLRPAAAAPAAGTQANTATDSDRSEWSFAQLSRASLAEVIELAERASDRAVVLTQLEEALQAWHRDPAARDQLSLRQYTQALELLHHCWQAVGANANVKLAAADCLVRLKEIISNDF